MAPPSLYDLSLETVVRDATNNQKNNRPRTYHLLPDHILFDFYLKMYSDTRLCLLGIELADFDIFARMLHVKHRRIQLLSCFQGLFDHNFRIGYELVDFFESKYSTGGNLIAIKNGIRVADFFKEGGWYVNAHSLLLAVKKLCSQIEDPVVRSSNLLETYTKLLFIESAFSLFQDGVETFKETVEEIETYKKFEKSETDKLDQRPNFAQLYANMSYLHSMRSEYEEAYKWAQLALQHIKKDMPKRILVDVLRFSAKACVFKRNLAKAGLLIEQATVLGQELYRKDGHPAYADVLLDYGFFLLNCDNIAESVGLFKEALNIRRHVFHRNNILIAIAYEDLAYAAYVNEYSSGKFDEADNYANNAMEIFERILPPKHLALASTKRVKALILEEIAVDMREPWTKAKQEQQLQKAKDLHLDALNLSLSVFGERNVQTAKHYGNLGRLYQSMQLYKEAEAMHLKAIAIKEEILGLEDYEVGLSLGHLASLYNFHMERYREAEILYMRSINISIKLFGSNYSGLEYDYRGLVNIYTQVHNIKGLFVYNTEMREWKRRREQQKIATPLTAMPLSGVVDQFFQL